MHKHYLSWGFAQSFHRSCVLVSRALPISVQHRLLRSVELMLQSFSKGLRAPANSMEQSRAYATALLTLRDAQEVLVESENWIPHSELVHRFEVLHDRLEVLCWGSVEEQGGQGVLPFIQG